MTDSELHAVISACLAQIAPEADVSSLPPTENIRDALDIDSFDFLQFLIALSEKLGLEVPEDDYAQLSTLDGMTSYLSAHLQSKPVSP